MQPPQIEARLSSPRHRTDGKARAVPDKRQVRLLTAARFTRLKDVVRPSLGDPETGNAFQLAPTAGMPVSQSAGQTLSGYPKRADPRANESGCRQQDDSRRRSD